MHVFPRLLTAIALVVTGALALTSCSSDDDTTGPVVPSGLEHSGAMVRIEASRKSFSMGSADGFADEQPVHTVTFSRDFWMDTTEVTQGEFSRVMSAAHAEFAAPDWNEPYGVGARVPAYLVEWGDAVLYCNARSTAEGLDPVYSYTGILGTPGNGCELEGVTADLTKSGYRLPTEAEWEFAARAGTAFDFSWGKNASAYPQSADDSTEIGANAVWAGNSWNLGSEDSRFGMQTVASKAPNAFGLYDMHGNAWEWCHDWYSGSYYGSSPSADPSGPVSGDWHTLRGGSWGNETPHLRASNRSFSTPDYLFNFIGFRTVRNVK